MPNILAYVLSFCIIGIFWNGHHTIFKFAKTLTGQLIWLNLFYLMVIGFMPLPTAVLAANYNDIAAVVLYDATLVVAGLLHFLFVWYIYQHSTIRNEYFTLKAYKQSKVASLFGAGCGVVAIAVSFIWIPFSWFFLILVPLYYIFMNHTYDRLHLDVSK